MCDKHLSFENTPFVVPARTPVHEPTLVDAEHGTCGADANLSVARTLLCAAAGEVAAYGARSREMIRTLKKAARGDVNMPIRGQKTIRNAAILFGLSTANKDVAQLAQELADLLLEDLNRIEPALHATTAAVASVDRNTVWAAHGLIPEGAYHEVFEAMHLATCTDGEDWRLVMDQLLRLGIAYSMNSVVGGAIAQDSLAGVVRRSRAKASLQVLQPDTVNIAIHGHAPELAAKIVETASTQTYAHQAEEAGAAGIQVYSMCSADLPLVEGVTALSNGKGASLVVATGALDLWLMEDQDVFPGAMNVSRCYKTAVATTAESALLPGVEHVDAGAGGVDEEKVAAQAEWIVARAIKSFTGRRNIKRSIPATALDAEVGYSLETLDNMFGCLEPVASALINGQIKGIVNLAGCTLTEPFSEQALVELVDILLANNILIFANGCVSLALAQLGYCSGKGYEKCGEGLQRFLGPNLGPVWYFGECLGHAHVLATFKEIAGYAGRQIKDLPFAVLSPQGASESNATASLSLRMHGFDVYHCEYPPMQGAEKVQEFLCRDVQEMVGSRLHVEAEPVTLAHQIIADFTHIRSEACWR